MGDSHRGHSSSFYLWHFFFLISLERVMLWSLPITFSAKSLVDLIPSVLDSHASFLIFQGSPNWRHKTISNVTLTHFLLGPPPEMLGFSQKFYGLQTSLTFSKYFNTTDQNKAVFSGCSFFFPFGKLFGNVCHSSSIKATWLRWSYDSWCQHSSCPSKLFS